MAKSNLDESHKSVLFGGYFLGGAATLFFAIVLMTKDDNSQGIVVNLFGVEITHPIIILLSPIILFFAGYLFMFLINYFTHSTSN